ncbi:hypothetical protein DPU24_23215 [Salmonella enterica subsp. enterica serovar Oranienburg]|nr:hypothetical protein [Salmonella enterica subsp. enterica serovar Oranienburg]
MFTITFYAYADVCSVDSSRHSLSCGGTINTSESASVGYGAYAHDGATSMGTDANASGWLSTAIGRKSESHGQQSVALGDESSASGDNSVSLGYGASTTKYNSVAIGSSSVADQENEVSIGNAANGLTRILTGLADGQGKNDAVTMGQLGDLDTKAKGYASAAQSAAEKTAQGYADSAKSEAISHSDTNLATAEGYTDKAKAEAISHSDNNLAAAKGYTDTAKGEANKYTDSEIVKEDTKAKGYASAAQSAAEKTAQGYATAAKGEAIKEANIYTDNSARQTLNSANSYTDRRSTQAENSAVARSNAYTDNRFGELRKNLEHTEKRLNAGIAGVTALSSIPYVEGNKFSYGIGAGTYQNGNAVAAGVQFRVSPSTNVRLNISWDSAGNNAAGVGIAGGW